MQLTSSAELERMRAHDLPTHGGRTLAYVYDSGLAEADEVGRQRVAAYAGTQRARPDRVPEPAAHGERARRLRRAPARRARERRSGR